MRIRKKFLVEVADFDFHPCPSSNQSEASIRFNRVVSSLKLIFSRDRFDSSPTTPEQCKPFPQTDDTTPMFSQDRYDSSSNASTPDQCKSFPQLEDSSSNKGICDSL
ncbi:hypothetical protein BsWGS_20438 [Bradybaena similaris]